VAEPKTGTAQVNAELPTDFLDEVKAFAEGRGEKLREVIYHALRRHLKYPPPPKQLPTEPLPDSPAARAEAQTEKPAARTRKPRRGRAG
jgi:hypothetical protein